MEHNHIHLRAEFTIEEGKTEESKKLVQDMSRVVEANEPDTMVYQFYLNKDETKCIVHETCTNSKSGRFSDMHASREFESFIQFVKAIDRPNIINSEKYVMIHAFSTGIQA